MEKAPEMIAGLFDTKPAWSLGDLDIELALLGLRYANRRELARDLRQFGYVSSSDGRVNRWHRVGHRVAVSKTVGAGEVLTVLERLTEGKASIGREELAAQIRAVFGDRVMPENIVYRLMERRGWRVDRAIVPPKWVKADQS